MKTIEKIAIVIWLILLTFATYVNAVHTLQNQDWIIMIGDFLMEVHDLNQWTN